jgi:flagellar biosynthesis protein FlhA
VITLDPTLEERIRTATTTGDAGLNVALSPQVTEAICQRIGEALARHSAAGRVPVLLVSPAIRPAVKQITSGTLPRLVVLSYEDVTRDTQLESLALVELESAGV